MKGLLYKEFCMFKAQCKSWVAAFLILGIYAAVFKSVGLLFTMTALFGFMSCLTTFSYDKAYRCDEYMNAMPVSRKKIVLSKYFFLFLMDIGITVFISAAVALLSSVFQFDAAEMFGTAVGVLGATALLQMLAIPAIYQWGPERARIFILLIGMSPFVLLMLNRNRLPAISRETLRLFAWLSPVFLVVLAAVSVMLSIAIYRKKEF